MRTRFALAALGFALAAGPAFAAPSVGVSGVDFLSIEQGARGLGMAGAFTAIADDENSLWWNPAGLGRDPFKAATFSQTLYLQDTDTEYIGYVRPFPQLRGTLGASFTYLSIPELDGTDASGNPTGRLKAGGYVGTLSYGTMLPGTGVSLGATGKYISQTLAQNSGTGIAADLGAQYRTDGWGLGLTIQNLGPAFKIGDTSDPLPREIRAGGFYDVWNRRVTLGLEEEKPYDQSLLTHVGAEWLVSQGVRLRAGFEQSPNAGGGAGLSVGFGLAGAVGGKPADKADSGEADAFKPFWERMGGAPSQDFQTSIKQGAVVIGIDYAFVDDGTLADVHRFTFTARF